MAAFDRSYWLAVGVVAYVGVASLQSTGLSTWRLLLFGALPWLLQLAWRRTQRGPRDARVERGTLQAMRIAATAAIVWLEARLGQPQVATLELAATAATGACAVTATYALARIAPAGGLVQPSKAVRSLDATAFSAFLWSAAVAVSLSRAVVPAHRWRLDPLTLDYANTAASVGGLLVLLAAAWRVRVMRRLELGVAERAEGALVLGGVALAVAVPAAAVDVAPPDRVVPAALILASVTTLWTVLASDPASVARVLRSSVALTLLGVPVLLLAGALSRQAPEHAAAIALVAGVATMAVGWWGRRAARPFAPAQARWLLAAEEAAHKALVPEPASAINRSLEALKRAFTSPKAEPQLWRLDPPAVLTVNVAGYLHEQSAELPRSLCEVALAEPERTLRVETLRALEVRRAEVRPLVEWFEVRDAACATLITDEDGVSGFLLMPRSGRRQPLTLEEARALRLLCDRISALLAVTASLARARRRESEALNEAERQRQAAQRALSVLGGQAQRYRSFAESIARPLLGATYSPAARMALHELKRRAASPSSLLLMPPVGVPSAAWAALAHLHSEHADGPFVVIDAGADATRGCVWDDPERSPVASARGGTLFIQGIHLLPLHTQQHIVEQLTEAPPQTGLKPARLMVACPYSLNQLIQQGRIDRALQSLVQESPLVLPPLRERAEDLRALVLECVSRCVSPLTGQPLGISRPALAALLEYEWPGNERQLYDVLERACDSCSGAMVELSDLLAVGFPFSAPPGFEPNDAAVTVQSSTRSAPPAHRTETGLRRRPRSPRRRGSSR